MKTPPGQPKGYFSPIYPLAYRRIIQVGTLRIFLIFSDRLICRALLT
jgi:hypothetical protein